MSITPHADDPRPTRNQETAARRKRAALRRRNPGLGALRYSDSATRKRLIIQDALAGHERAVQAALRAGWVERTGRADGSVRAID